MAIFTEELGLLIAAARAPGVSIRRSALVRDGRLISKSILGITEDMQVTNAAVDSLLGQKLLDRVDGGLQLNLEGARTLGGLVKRLWMLSQLLEKTGALAHGENTDVERQVLS